ncbi:MAG: Smr/MutS family protein [Bacteroidales bacterium]|jgi:DNA mismatch repair protein MutS2|nr:Smr/MutS family protein [Bacteroidales bacterium]MCI1784800.1 Smr/MutS family protein [Bacteroidales bacterium]
MDIDERLESKLGFDRIREMIADRCSTEYAAKKAASEIFCTDPKEIRKKLLLTDEMRLIVMFEDSFPVNGYVDCLYFLKPLAKPGANIDLLSLGKLRTMLETVRKTSAFFRNIKDGVYPNLKKMSSSILEFPEIQRHIDTILDKFGNIKDTASDNLYEIRKSIREKESSVSKTANAILRKARENGITDSDANISIRDGKILVPVNSANKRKLDGYVYDESASGKTTFIEPAEIVTLQNELNGLHFAETREINKILCEFSDFLRPYTDDLMDASRYIGELDFLMAKARLSLDFAAGMPIISENGEESLRKARHPLLEQSLKKEHKEIVPLSLSLTSKKHILLISGPNAGGKSVCLKTVGLLQYMFQWGMLIPTSEVSELNVFDRIMISIGDDQSIDNDLSTYSSFLSDMKEMLAAADENTLILIDEFGAGTEPAAGGAIAEAILSEMDKRRVYGIITTHYTNLKLYASADNTGVVNGAMQFDAKNISPLFRLEMGLPGNSFAFELARKMGLPEEIVRDAESRAGKEFVGIERNLKKIARNKRSLDEKLQRIRTTDKVLENITGKYQKELEDIKSLKKEILDQAKQEAEDIVGEANRKIESTIRIIKESQADKEKTKEARLDLQEFISAVKLKKEQDEKDRDDYLEKKLGQLKTRQEKENQRKSKRNKAGDADTAQTENARKIEIFRNAPLKIGEKVRIKENGLAGEIVRVSNKSVTVAIGNISTKTPLDKVERITSNEFKTAVKSAYTPPVQKIDEGMSERKLNFKTEIDVRGERVSDAINIISGYVDDAIMLDMHSIRIIHGKGTGALREEIQKYLRTVPGISSVSDETLQAGGSGVTVVVFE